MRRFYTLIFYLILPLVLLRLLWRSRLAPAYRQRVAERLGIFSQSCPGGCIWVHAVSVGETIAAAPLIHALLARYPALPLVVTTMTPTGSERVRALFGDSVIHVYAPYDLPGCVGRFLHRVKPVLAIIMETELWPNSINACARRGIPVVLANARLSARSARGYWRARALTAPMLRQLTRVVAQNSVDGARFVELGLPRERLRVSGSIKFDITLEPSVLTAAASAKSQWQTKGRLIWIAASTHAGEDEIILAAQRQLRTAGIETLLILVPRHPERFDAVATLIERAGFSLQRRSQNAVQSAAVEVLLGDTMGELLWLYGCADIAFVGGSLVPRGGHNTLEPAAWGLPILSGPSDFNFRAIATLLQESGALVEVSDADALARALVLLAHDPAERARRGDAARAVIDKNRGAIEQLLAEIAQLLPARS